MTTTDTTHPRQRSLIPTRHIAAMLVIALALAFLPSVPDASAQVPWIKGWTYLHDDGHAHFACQREVNSSRYGPLWEVRTLTIDRPGGNDRFKPWYRMISIAGIRNDRTYKWDHNSGWLGTMNGNTMYLSRYHRDRLWIQTNGYGPYDPARDRSFSPSTFARCL